jgi:hypothetical protein
MHSENYTTSNLPSLYNRVQKNITMRKWKRQIFCWRSGNSINKKTTPGQANPWYPLFRRQSLYIDSITHIPDAAIVSSTLTCNPTQTPPNQVTYLKESSMESFILGPTPKIDFSSHSNSTRKLLESEQIITITSKINSLSTMEFTTEFLQTTCLGASIYRLQKSKIASD